MVLVLEHCVGASCRNEAREDHLCRKASFGCRKASHSCERIALDRLIENVSTQSGIEKEHRNDRQFKSKNTFSFGWPGEHVSGINTHVSGINKSISSKLR